jgi:hypothetical protein
MKIKKIRRKGGVSVDVQSGQVDHNVYIDT